MFVVPALKRCDVSLFRERNILMSHAAFLSWMCL